MSASPPPGDLTALRDALRAFAAARDWDQFHTPKNLAAALSVEAAELLEIFQWMSAKESECASLSPGAHAAARAEIADVLLYLIRIADKLGVDPIAAAREKMAVNALKYPVESSRGSAKKYSAT